jgi:hypothetical protein
VPALIVTVVVAVPPDDAEKTAPVELDESVTVVFEATFTGLPDELSTWHTIGPSVALFEADPDTDDVVMTSLVAVAPLTTVLDIADPQVLAAVLLFASPPYEAYHQ